MGIGATSMVTKRDAVEVSRGMTNRNCFARGRRASKYLFAGICGEAQKGELADHSRSFRICETLSLNTRGSMSSVNCAQVGIPHDQPRERRRSIDPANPTFPSTEKLAGEATALPSVRA